MQVNQIEKNRKSPCFQGVLYCKKRQNKKKVELIH